MANKVGELQEYFQGLGKPLPAYHDLGGVGQPHCRTHSVLVSVQWEGEQLSEHGEGRSKKDAKRDAAERMLRRLATLSRQSHSPSPRTPPPPRSPDSIEPDLVDRPVGSPSANIKGALQEKLQQTYHPPPEYLQVSRTGPSHRPEFRVKCVVRNMWDKVVAEEFGQGRSVKEAERNAAERMIQSIGDQLESGLPLLPSPGRRQTPPPEIIDPDLDGDLAHFLSRFKPEYEFRIGTEKCMLCLARATHGYEFPVTACGKGESESQAKRDAACNLASNLNELTPKIVLQS